MLKVVLLGLVLPGMLWRLTNNVYDICKGAYFQKPPY